MNLIHFSTYILLTCVSALQIPTFFYIHIDVILYFQSEEHVNDFFIVKITSVAINTTVTLTRVRYHFEGYLSG